MTATVRIGVLNVVHWFESLAGGDLKKSWSRSGTAQTPEAARLARRRATFISGGRRNAKWEVGSWKTSSAFAAKETSYGRAAVHRLSAKKTPSSAIPGDSSGITSDERTSWRFPPPYQRG